MFPVYVEHFISIISPLPWGYQPEDTAIISNNLYLAPEWGYNPESSGIVLRCSMGTVNYCNSR